MSNIFTYRTALGFSATFILLWALCFWVKMCYLEEIYSGEGPLLNSSLGIEFGRSVVVLCWISFIKGMTDTEKNVRVKTK